MLKEYAMYRARLNILVVSLFLEIVRTSSGERMSVLACSNLFVIYEKRETMFIFTERNRCIDSLQSLYTQIHVAWSPKT